MDNNKTVKYEELFKNKKAAIFDMDGTISDSMQIWEAIDTDFLSRRGLEMPSDLQSDIKGISIFEVAVYFKKRFGLEESCQELIREWNDMAYELYATKILPKPGVLRLLNKLKQDGIKMAVATSNTGMLLKAFLTNNNLNDYFEYLCTGEEITKGKPFPDCYLHTAEMIQVDPSDCVVFEDVSEGIISGKSAGMTVCGLSDDYSASERDTKIELADYYVDSLEELF